MMGDWTFFSNHGHVLVCLARDREVRLRDVAQDVGITERAVQKIVRDLQDAGFLEVRKQGRCNRYRINRRKALRHALESHVTVGKLLTLLATSGRLVKVPAPQVVPDPGSPSERAAAPGLEKRPGPGREAEPKTETESGLNPKSKSQPQPKAGAAPADDKKQPADPRPDTDQQGSLF